MPRPLSEHISRRVQAVDASGIRKVFDLAAKLKDPINLSIGLPDFDVPAAAKEVAIAAIREGKNKYTQTQGIEPLRQRIHADLAKEFGREPGDVLITSGVAGGLLLAAMVLLDAGDEAVFLDPYFVMYRHFLTMIGAKSVAVDSYPTFRFDKERVRAAITPKTKMMILNTPSNPTGLVMSQQEIDDAVEVAREFDLVIVCDEIYDPFLYDGPIISPAAKYERTVILRGFSKSHAMTGWRLGYAVGPAEIIQQMAKLQQYTYICAPAPFQSAALAALDISMAEHVTAYHRKRDLVYAAIKDTFNVEKPSGAFYIFPEAPKGLTATEFVHKSIENNVLVIPGSVFSAKDTHFRISYAATDEKLHKGCEILCKLAKGL